MAVGRLAAKAKRTIVSGGAKGIDQAAMRGAIEAGGKVSGVLGDSLEKTTMNRENRNLLLDGQLVLISPYDPSAGFNVGNAMQRNKLIYALADSSLVVSSDLNKGGTWTGAVEQLDKLNFVPVYVRSTGEASVGLDALRKKGALPWPNPQNTDEFEGVFNTALSTPVATKQAEPSLFTDASSEIQVAAPVIGNVPDELGTAVAKDVVVVVPHEDKSVSLPAQPPPAVVKEEAAEPEMLTPVEKAEPKTGEKPSDALFATVKELIKLMLKVPMKDAEVAAALDVSSAQAKAWLQRLVDEGAIEKQKKPAGYIVKQSSLFE